MSLRKTRKTYSLNHLYLVKFINNYNEYFNYVKKYGIDDVIKYCFTHGLCCTFAHILSIRTGFKIVVISSSNCVDGCHVVCYDDHFLYDINGKHKKDDLIEYYNIVHNSTHYIDYKPLDDKIKLIPWSVTYAELIIDKWLSIIQSSTVQSSTAGGSSSSSSSS